MPAVEFRLPDIGEGLAEVELVRWLVGVGDTVQENQPIAEVETDKSIVTMPAPASGAISRLCVNEGERLKVGAVMVIVDVADAAHPVAATKIPTAGAVSATAAGFAVSDSAAVRTATPVQASPAIRRLARDLGVTLEHLQGSGAGGRITEADVRRHAETRAAAAGAPSSQPTAREEIESVPFRGLRRRIAEAMERSVRTIPHVTGFHEFDVGHLVALHAELRPRAEARGIRLTYLPIIVKALVEALQRFAYLNASLDEQAEVIRLKKFYNIGIATATEAALAVPVIRHADRLSLADLAREMERLVSAARKGALAPGDQQNGTFTITNVGGARGWLNTSIIRHPEVAILGVGRIEQRPVVRDGRVVAGWILPLALTFDHRVIDGDTALAFMLAMRESLEHPGPLLREASDW